MEELFLLAPVALFCLALAFKLFWIHIHPTPIPAFVHFQLTV